MIRFIGTIVLAGAMAGCAANGRQTADGGHAGASAVQSGAPTGKNAAIQQTVEDQVADYKAYMQSHPNPDAHR
jgi:hypothetical protein